MKIKLSKSQWELIGKKTGWLSKSAISKTPDKPEGMCKQCGEKPAAKVLDENGDVLGVGDYCPECDKGMDNGPFTRLVRQYGEEKAAEILRRTLKGEDLDDIINGPKYDPNAI